MSSSGAGVSSTSRETSTVENSPFPKPSLDELGEEFRILVFAECDLLVTLDSAYRVRVTKSKRPYVYVSKEANKMKTSITSQVRPLGKEIVSSVLFYDAVYYLYAPESYWVTSEGEMSRKDASNVLKPVEDAISAGLGIDDRYARKISVEKRISECGKYYVCASLDVRVGSGRGKKRVREFLIPSAGESNRDEEFREARCHFHDEPGNSL